MMVDILDPREGESIYDPACGTGGMLLGAIEHAQRAGGDPRTFFGKIYGQVADGSAPDGQPMATFPYLPTPFGGYTSEHGKASA